MEEAHGWSDTATPRTGSAAGACGSRGGMRQKKGAAPRVIFKQLLDQLHLTRTNSPKCFLFTIGTASEPEAFGVVFWTLSTTEKCATVEYPRIFHTFFQDTLNVLISE